MTYSNPTTTDLPVMLEPKYRGPDALGFSRWLASMPVWALPVCLTLLFAWPTIIQAQTVYSADRIAAIMAKWLPLLVMKLSLIHI